MAKTRFSPARSAAAARLTTAGGMLTLTGANSYSGLTNVSAGTLQLGNGVTSGSVSGNIADNAAVVFASGTAQSYAGNVTGAGGVTVAGTSTLTLSGDNSYGGGTLLSSGTLDVGGDNALPSSGNVSIAGGGVGPGRSQSGARRRDRRRRADYQQHGDCRTECQHDGGRYLQRHDRRRQRHTGHREERVRHVVGGRRPPTPTAAAPPSMRACCNSGSATALGSPNGELLVNGGSLDLAGNIIPIGALGSANGQISSSVSGSVTLTAGSGNAALHPGRHDRRRRRHSGLAQDRQRRLSP